MKHLSGLRLLARKLGLLVFSTVTCICALELALCALGPPVRIWEMGTYTIAARARRAKALGVPYDTRTPFDVITEMRNKGVQAYPSGGFEAYLRYGQGSLSVFTGNPAALPSPYTVHSRIASDNGRILPLGHRSRSITVDSENENGYYAVFRTDEHGFRNPARLWSLEDVDIVGVGDSFVEGCGVRDEDSIISRIRARVPRTISLGLGGGSPLTALAALREYGRTLKPEVVLWCFYEEDLEDLAYHMRCPILTSYLRDEMFSQDLQNRQPEVDAALSEFFEADMLRVRRLRNSRSGSLLNRASAMTRSFRSFLSLPRVRHRVRALVYHWFPVAIPDNKEVLAAFWEIPAKAKSLVESWGGRFYFVYVPVPAFLMQPENRLPERYVLFRSAVPEGMQKMGIPVINLLDVLDKYPEPASLVPLGFYGHFTPRGNQIVADEIIRRLAEDPKCPIQIMHDRSY